MQFATKTDQEISMQILFGDRRIATAWSLKFLGLIIDNSLTWRHHIIELTSRLKLACFAIRSITPFLSIDVLRGIYFSYMHSIIPHGIIFWLVMYPGILFRVGGGGCSTNSVEDRGQREWGTGGSSPLVRGSTQFANEWNPCSY
jgi:hypothetical protein